MLFFCFFVVFFFVFVFCGRAEKKIIPRWKVLGLFFLLQRQVFKKCRYLGNEENIVVFDSSLNNTVVANWRHYVWKTKDDISF